MIEENSSDFSKITAVMLQNYLVSGLRLQVLKPKGKYKGQKLTKLVTTNTAANASKTSPNTPVTVPVKYRAANIAAKTNLTTLSMLPTFFFICFYF